jgi:hypothetical protein
MGPRKERHDIDKTPKDAEQLFSSKISPPYDKFIRNVVVDHIREDQQELSNQEFTRKRILKRPKEPSKKGKRSKRTLYINRIEKTKRMSIKRETKLREKTMKVPIQLHVKPKVKRSAVSKEKERTIISPPSKDKKLFLSTRQLTPTLPPPPEGYVSALEHYSYVQRPRDNFFIIGGFFGVFTFAIIGLYVLLILGLMIESMISFIIGFFWFMSCIGLSTIWTPKCPLDNRILYWDKVRSIYYCKKCKNTYPYVVDKGKQEHEKPNN